MSSTSPTNPSRNAHDPWRVILVGRTGLDQTLRRDDRIELIRCRDTIEAIGELSDPIDQHSPTQSVVIVSADAVDPEERAQRSFINALRLIDPAVLALRVASEPGCFDACVGQDHSLDELIGAIESCVELDAESVRSEPVTLRFIEAPNDHPEPELTPVSEPEPEPEPEPEISVVVSNETFEHPAGMTDIPSQSGALESEHEYEVTPGQDEADELHQRIIMGHRETHDQLPESVHAHRARDVGAPAVSDDEPVVLAILRAQPVLPAALKLINSRLGRSDIDLLPVDAPGAELGVPVVVGDRPIGLLCSADHAWLNAQGRSLLSRHARWLATWIKLETQQSELRRCAFTDTLTGAWNRRYFDRFLSAAIDQSRLARQPLTVMIFDIDSFKHYNDTYGHGAGDEILIETVRLLKSVIRPSDRVCRVGGDEFAVIFYEPQGPRDPSSKPLESIYQIARRFQQQICKHRFPKLGHEAMGTLTVSGGLASFPWDGHDAASLLEQADRYAIESKRQGKNAITLGPGAESICKTDL